MFSNLPPPLDYHAESLFKKSVTVNTKLIRAIITMIQILVNILFHSVAKMIALQTWSIQLYSVQYKLHDALGLAILRAESASIQIFVSFPFTTIPYSTVGSRIIRRWYKCENLISCRLFLFKWGLADNPMVVFSVKERQLLPGIMLYDREY